MTSNNQSINASENLGLLNIAPEQIEEMNRCATRMNESAVQLGIAAGITIEKIKALAYQYGIPSADYFSTAPISDISDYFQSNSEAKCLIDAWKHRHTLNRLINDAHDADQPAYLIDSLVQSRIRLEQYYDHLFYRIKKMSGFSRYEIEKHLGESSGVVAA
jgi:hypothetical protein